MPLFGIDPEVQGLLPTRDAAIIQSHIVSRPDLVRIDQERYPSEIATLIVGGKIFEDWESVWIQWSRAAEFSHFNSPTPSVSGIRCRAGVAVRAPQLRRIQCGVRAVLLS
jgi:hypothetical protein